MNPAVPIPAAGAPDSADVISRTVLPGATPGEPVSARTLRLGLIGLDTSHADAFAEIINNPANSAHLPGVRITAAFPAGSADFPLSFNRVEGYTAGLRDKFGVTIVPSIRAVTEAVDAILITSVDGRVHRSQFEEIAAAGKPVFIDKPLATGSADARRIAAIAAAHGTRFFSSSNLRFSGALQEVLTDGSLGAVERAEFFGPLRFEPTQPGYFWYGIHTVEMVYATLGPGCVTVQVGHENGMETITGTWHDGRVGIARLGLTTGRFGGVVRRSRGSRSIDVTSGRDPIVGLTRAMIAFFRGGTSPVPIAETLELVRFIEAANESRQTDGWAVAL